ncbi:MAG: PEP-CTERM sorting domain-containing protein [Candidatus Korobacteraceae bacterium]
MQTKVAGWLLGGCLFVVSLTGSIAQAAQIIVNFDSPPFPSLETGVYVDGVITRFDRNTVVGYGPYNILPCACANTPPNAAFGYAYNPLAQVVSGVDGSFWVNVGSTFVLGTTDFVSFYVVGTIPGQTASWIVRFYSKDPYADLSQNVIATFTGTTDQLVSLSYPEIQAFVFLPSGPNVLNEGIDTLVFDTPKVPEPATLGLFSLGLAAASLLRPKFGRH